MKNLKTKENRRVVWKKLLLVCLAILFIIFITYITGNKRLFNKVSQQKLAENEEMVKIMMSSMGRTPSQKQVNQVMKQMQRVK